MDWRDRWDELKRQTKAGSALDRLAENALYEQVANELETGQISKGEWMRALAKSGGDETRAKAEYVTLRVQALKDQLAVTEEFQRRARNAGRAPQTTREPQASSEQRTSGSQNRWTDGRAWLITLAIFAALAIIAGIVEAG